MPTYNSIKAAIDHIKKQINESLNNEVFETVREIELEHIYDDVIESYTPTVYARRDARGIEDPANIVSLSSKDGVLEVENVTQFNPDYGTDNTGHGLVGLIEFGNGWNAFNYEYPSSGGSLPYNQPRPFTQNTIDDLKRNKQHITALKEGLVNRGIDVT